MKENEKKAIIDKNAKKGKNSIMNGRALFNYNPDAFKDDENAADIEFEEEKEESKTNDDNNKADAAVDKDLFANEEVNEDEEVDFD